METFVHHIPPPVRHRQCQEAPRLVSRIARARRREGEKRHGGSQRLVWRGVFLFASNNESICPPTASIPFPSMLDSSHPACHVWSIIIFHRLLPPKTSYAQALRRVGETLLARTVDFVLPEHGRYPDSRDSDTVAHSCKNLDCDWQYPICCTERDFIGKTRPSVG